MEEALCGRHSPNRVGLSGGGEAPPPVRRATRLQEPAMAWGYGVCYRSTFAAEACWLVGSAHRACSRLKPLSFCARAKAVAERDAGWMPGRRFQMTIGHRMQRVRGSGACGVDKRRAGGAQREGNCRCGVHGSECGLTLIDPVTSVSSESATGRLES